ncbi:unnamed protein product [Chironomus riparius]|uniref:Envelope protein n=1 Tax=Chironomus riparius TaxID=315576 RepID=A0A9N9RUS3_9DIPT|nr:unnamed protein product [Chironomus riparius]
MNLVITFFVIFNILLANGLEYQHIQPGVVVEDYGKVGMIDDYFHVAFRVNFTAFYLNEFSDLKTSVTKLCSEIKWKLKEEHQVCKDQLVDFHQNFKDKSEELLKSLDTKDQLNSNSYKLSDLNKIKHGEQDHELDKMKNLVVLDFTNDIFPNIIEDATSLIKSLDTLREVATSMENDIEPVDEKINQHFDILEKFMESCNEYLLELETIISQAQNHKVNYRLLKNILLKDVLEGKLITNNVYHIIDLNSITANNVADIGPSIGSTTIQSMIKTAVYKENNIPYIIMSLPLSRVQNVESLKLVKLKPIPKLEKNILTFIKANPNFFIHNIDYERPHFFVEDLNCCYRYNGNFYCDYFNKTEESSTACVSNVFEIRTKDFCKYYGCKMVYLENFGSNIIELQKKYSYIVVTQTQIDAEYTGGSFKNMKLEIPTGSSLIHSKIPITLKLNNIELKFEKDISGKVLYPRDFDFYFYDVSTAKVDQKPDSELDLGRSFSTMDVVTVDTIYKLSTKVPSRKKELKKENDETSTSAPKVIKIIRYQEPLYIVLTKILLTAVCLTVLLLIFFKYVLKYKFVVNLRAKEEKEPLKEKNEK